MAEIEPCPFCGPTPCIRPPMAKSRNANTASGKHYFVHCAGCHTEGPRSTLNKTEAVNKWNKRATATKENTHE